MTAYRLSQQQLNVLSNCPRKFQHIYLDNLYLPTTYEEQEPLLWGTRFHLLMQQRELGLPIEPLISENPEMEQCFNAFLQAAPEILTPTNEEGVFRQAEYTRILNFPGYILTVIYDLLIAGPENAQILDWKTYRRHPNQSDLAKNWQTRLYPFVLVETSDYLPEEVSMTYWFVRGGVRGLPESLKFSYNQQSHEQIRQDLSLILSQLTYWLECYQEDGELFPQIDASTGECNFCQFAIRCQRFQQNGQEADEELVAAGQVVDWLSNLDSIEEVSI